MFSFGIHLYYRLMELDDISFTYESLSPEKYWEERNERFAAIKMSNELYDRLDYSQRKTTVKLVRRALELAIENVEEWLSDSFTFDDKGNLIGVNIKLIATDLDKAVADEVRITQTRVREILEDLGPDIKDVRDDS